MPGARENSSRTCEITTAVTNLQQRMLDLADRKYGLTRKVIALESGIPVETLKEWSNGTKMPLSAFVKILSINGFPNELASLVLEPACKSICDSEADEIDLDDTAVAAADYLAKYAKARHPKSPSGIKIDHTEQPDLELAAERFHLAAAKVAG